MCILTHIVIHIDLLVKCHISRRPDGFSNTSQYRSVERLRLPGGADHAYRVCGPNLPGRLGQRRRLPGVSVCPGRRRNAREGGSTIGRCTKNYGGGGSAAAVDVGAVVIHGLVLEMV